MKLIVILLTLILLTSCSNHEDQTEVEDNKIHHEGEVDTDVSIDIDELENAGIPADRTQIKFNELTILLENIEMGWDDQDSFDDRSCEVDEIAYFNLYMGDWMYGKRIQIMEEEFDDIQIYVQEVIHVAMNSSREIEVPFCVLTDWKSITSEWTKIEQTNDQMIFNSQDKIYTDSIPYRLEQFKKAVRKSCGEKWYKEISQIESLEDLPATEFTSRYN
ncbi:MAG: hypothetical protein JKY54_00065 [Flavobacteriales bacterium]|nr:hypothetical protein [Flavobacteriales bacterium]